MKITISVLVLLFAFACNNKPQIISVEKTKAEIIEIEKDFNVMANEKGIAKAFLHYAADDAVLMRNNKLIKGKDSIAVYFEQRKEAFDNATLTWQPDFVEVSASGDLAYTYGNYLYSDNILSSNISKGVFHTVWKKQTDGTWKFVWD